MRRVDLLSLSSRYSLFIGRKKAKDSRFINNNNSAHTASFKISSVEPLPPKTRIIIVIKGDTLRPLVSSTPCVEQITGARLACWFSIKIDVSVKNVGFVRIKPYSKILLVLLKKHNLPVLKKHRPHFAKSKEQVHVRSKSETYSDWWSIGNTTKPSSSTRTGCSRFKRERTIQIIAFIIARYKTTKRIYYQSSA